MTKRLFDLIASGLLLIGLAPLMTLVAIVIKLWMPGPVFYSGLRVGRGGRLFKMLKFRSMIVDADKRGGTSTAGDDPRLTPVGRFIRQFKIDELPQLINVLTGDMSFVGPRPQVEWAVKLYSDVEREVLSVRPGITDPASLRFANEAEILKGAADPDRAYLELIHPEKMRLSLDYVRRRTFWGDLKIIGCTALAALGVVSYAVDPHTLKAAH